MGYRVEPHDERVLRVVYSGDVGYRERSAALHAAAERMAREGYSRLLVDFSFASVYDEGDGSRADFIAAVIMAPWPPETRIAPLNAPRVASEGSRIAGTSRGLRVRHFESETAAIEWLTDGS